FVAEFDTLKTGADSLVYSTLLGGHGCDHAVNSICGTDANTGDGIDGDVATGISVDPVGRAYVGGLTYSRDFPITRHGGLLGLIPFQGVHNGSELNRNNGFASILAADGSRL